MITDPEAPVDVHPPQAGGASFWDRAITIPVQDCVNGFPPGVGPESADVPPTTFQYNLVVVFESLDKLHEYQARPAQERQQIENTMARFMRDAGNTPLNWEALGDQDPKHLNAQTLDELNRFVGPELVRIMNASYPGIGISQAGVHPDDVETPGCAYPKDKVEIDTPYALDRTAQSVLIGGTAKL
ncbi:MAG: hypothetical protein H6858_10150 [Rhodospirillales bacterium]|nr:hypothetical protein [Alphaproteobacteria bacterium]MCB9977948.1 hypothetical protein [Rhodospirillales bacterium]